VTLRQAQARAVRRSVGAAGIALIQQFEGCARPLADGRFAAYPDPGSKNGRPWTVGWGSTGPEIGPGTVWTRAQCEERFARDLQRLADEVAEAIGQAPTAQHQFDALVSFHYNTGAIRRAALTRRHVAGDHAGAQSEFSRWVYNDGRKMPGLVRRRAAEAALYGGTE
jgi:GH24 family phage-related lysozyme (muramidase)